MVGGVDGEAAAHEVEGEGEAVAFEEAGAVAGALGAVREGADGAEGEGAAVFGAADREGVVEEGRAVALPAVGGVDEEFAGGLARVVGGGVEPEVADDAVVDGGGVVADAVAGLGMGDGGREIGGDDRLAAGGVGGPDGGGEAGGFGHAGVVGGSDLGDVHRASIEGQV